MLSMSLTIKISKELKNKLRDFAKKEKRSLGNYVRLILEKYIQEIRNE